MRTERDENAEANYFAICLLMPQEFVHSELDALMDRGITDEEAIMRRLSRKFQVSEVVMTMRLVELGRMIAP